MATDSIENIELTTDRASRLDDELGVPMAAVERFLVSRNFEVPNKNERFFVNVVEKISDKEYDDLITQYLYAGRQTINYFVVVGISEFDFTEIVDRADRRLPSRDEVAEVTKEPFFATCEERDNRLYISFGYFERVGGKDPLTGAKNSTTVPRRIVVIISRNGDLVEIRGSDTTQVDRILDELCKSIGKYQDSVKRRPNLGTDFQERFNDRVESYYNLSVKVDDDDDQALDTVSFTSTQEESGYRHDARDSKRVERELSEDGSEITTGYVELSELRFRINRREAKISFVKYEREENLNQVTDFINDVLKEVGEYSQGKLSGIDDVPE